MKEFLTKHRRKFSFSFFDVAELIVRSLHSDRIEISFHLSETPSFTAVMISKIYHCWVKSIKAIIY